MSEVNYEEEFKKCFAEFSGGVGFCEKCGFVVMDYHGWRDMENRLCFECAEYESEAEYTPSTSSEEDVDSDIDDPDWIPPVWLVQELEEELANESNDDDDDESDYDSGEVDRVGSF